MIITTLCIYFTFNHSDAKAQGIVKSNHSVKLNSQSNILGLGDSSITGYDCMCENLLTYYANRIGTKKFDNYGVNGSTTTMMLEQLKNNDIKNSIKKSQSILLIIGANDLNSVREDYIKNNMTNITYNKDKLYNTTISNINTIVNQIKTIHGNDNVNINLVGYWNLFSDGSKAVNQDGYREYAWSIAYTTKFNNDLLKISKNDHINFIDSDKILKKYGKRDNYISEDGEHLNSTGYQIIANNIPK